MKDVKSIIRDVPDFPKKGIVFKDITPLLNRPDLLQKVVEALAGQFSDREIDRVVAVESRGFIIGAPVALKLNAGFVPVRKPGKLPWQTVGTTYELEYGTDSIEMHKDAIEPGQNVLIVDDLLATGGTARACAELVEKLGGRVVGLAFVVELSFLNGREKLDGYDLVSLVQYDSP